MALAPYAGAYAHGPYAPGPYFHPYYHHPHFHPYFHHPHYHPYHPYGYGGGVMAYAGWPREDELGLRKK